MADTDLKSFLNDLFSRSLHTVWETGVPLAIALWAASGLHLADLAQTSGRQKALLTVLLPLGSGILAALRVMAVAWYKANKTEVKELTDAELTQLHLNMGFVEPTVPAAPVSTSAVAAGAVITGDPA